MTDTTASQYRYVKVSPLLAVQVIENASVEHLSLTCHVAIQYEEERQWVTERLNENLSDQDFTYETLQQNTRRENNQSVLFVFIIRHISQNIFGLLETNERLLT